MEPDFSGYATKNDLRCSDGRIIMAHAFKDNDGQKVPLVFQHVHNHPDNILGHAVLENREDGVYAYGYFNDTPSGQMVKKAVQHGDLNSLSIYANQLVQRGERVQHGVIKEVSIVLAGANPGAVIDNVALAHGENLFEEIEDEVIIRPGFTLEHGEISSSSTTAENSTDGDPVSTDTTETPAAEKTPKEIYDSMDDDQKKFVQLVAAKAMEEAEKLNSEDDADDEDLEDDTTEDMQHSDLNDPKETPMSRNLFDQDTAVTKDRATLSHAQIQTIMEDAKTRFNGSVKASFLAHADEYGIENIDMLFPDAKNLDSSPQFKKRRTEWVADVLGGVNASPFSKVKSIVADITADEARARGYVTGTMKKDEVIQLLKRTTGPTTIYKKQKLDRDDIIDITDLDVIAWLKAEMRLMIDEEVARAILLGDGRAVNDEDKIKDPAGALDGNGIRSIANDDSFYAHQIELQSNVSTEKAVEELIRARTHYKGSGNPAFYTTDTFISDMLLLKDKIGRRIYETVADVAAAIRVSRIVAVEVMEAYPNILGIMVNLTDYTVGTNKGGELNFFDDFDIDWNQYKYLIETRLTGALTKPKSAVVVKRTIGTAATPVSPDFAGATNTITIPTTTGIVYSIDGEPVTGTVVITADTEVTASADDGYYIPNNTVVAWTFTYTSED